MKGGALPSNTSKKGSVIHSIHLAHLAYKAIFSSLCLKISRRILFSGDD
jgi:hypothetical protein